MIVRGQINYSQGIEQTVRNEKSENTFKFCSSTALVQIFSSPFEKTHRNRIVVTILKNGLIQENSVSHDGTEFSCINDPKYYSDDDKETLALEIEYDETSNNLSLKRDVFSEIPLYFIHIPNHLVAFSNNIEILTQIDGVRSFLEIDNHKVASYLSFDQLSRPYDTATFFSNIKSVLPGHQVTINNNTTSWTAITKFDISRWNNLHSKEEYGRAFREVFQNSVSKIINSRQDHRTTASHLSGGLDSSFISAMIKYVAPGRTLHTFYGETNTPLTNELHYAEEVAQEIGSIHHTVPPPYDEIDKLILHTEILGSPLSKMHSPAREHAIMQAIKEVGGEILLTGEGGDSIVGYGNQYLGLLFNQRNWIKLKDELSKSAHRISNPFIHSNWDSLTNTQKEYYFIRSSLYRLLAFKFKELSTFEFINLFTEVVNEFDTAPQYFLKKGISAFLDKFFRKKINTLNRCSSSYPLPTLSSLTNKLRGDLPNSFQSSFSPVFSTIAINVTEDYHALSNYFGIETRFPFYDKDLFELSLATPISIKYDNGMRRGHLREAMKGIVPENVRLRQGKASFDLFARQSAIRLHDQSQDFLTKSSPVWEHVNKKQFDRLVSLLKKDNQELSTYTSTFFQVNRTIFLAVWLDWQKRSI